jgi:UDP-N-acetylmuramoylalanine--D-glutamate ligase
VTVTDKRSAEVLQPALADLRHLPVRWVLGEHKEEDFLGAELVIPSPAVPRSAPLLALCLRRGVPLDTEMNLFFKYCRGRICAVTGSNGKTTTTCLVGSMAALQWPSTRTGGNLGKSLLPEVDSIREDQWVVLELSSFQLEDLAPLSRRPEVSVVTNLSPNHLDRHGTYEAYVDAKREILSPAGAPNTAVLNAEDPLTRSWARPGRRTLFFGRAGRVAPSAPGAWIDEAREEVYLERHASRLTLFASRDLKLMGRFNLMNAAAAAAAASAMGVGPSSVRQAVRDFKAMEHRLEFVASHKSVDYFNDSIATTPESTLAALEALGPNVVVICGGSSKGCSFHQLGQALFRRARGVVLLGQTAEAIRASLPCRPGGPRVEKVTTLEEAVHKARDMARGGDRVILSPSCASFDMFVNFEERGRQFKEIVREIASSPCSP